MGPLHCEKCGFVLPGVQNEKFCPNCGSLLSQNFEISANAEKGIFCPVCGTARGSPDAKFCPNCGTGFKQEMMQAIAPTPNITMNSQSIPPTPVVQPQATRIKLVVGELLKSVPIANMIVPEGKLGGSIQLRRDGVLFITKSKTVIQSHITDITDIRAEGEDNVITLTMMNGEKRTFAFIGARRWVDKVLQLQSP